MSGHPKLRIAIVGGGVCGITCAAALAKNGIYADVYEAKVRCHEFSAGAKSLTHMHIRVNLEKLVQGLV